MTNPEIFQKYSPKNKIRMVTATALFDGHDASINIMRRLLQARGVEVVHLGHNRSAKEIVDAAIQEDAHAIALSSYQGGHVEFFKYVRELLNEQGAHEVKIFGGGGGVIVSRERQDLESSGITKIYGPEEGQSLGLHGIIGHMLYSCDHKIDSWGERNTDFGKLARSISLMESQTIKAEIAHAKLGLKKSVGLQTPVIGITGTGGAGKSSLTDELIGRFIYDYPNAHVAVLCVDPTKMKTGGALLGDRIRMNSIVNSRVFVRSLATRGSGSELAQITRDAVELLKSQDFDIIIVETSGIGQGDAEILKVSNISLYVMTPEYGASSQLEKIDMLDFADLIAINKFERRQALDAIRDVRTVLRRNRFQGKRMEDREYPVYGTIASRFADDGVNGLYRALIEAINKFLSAEKFPINPDRKYAHESSNRDALIPGDRINYLSEVSRAVRNYHLWVKQQVEITRKIEGFSIAASEMHKKSPELAALLLKEAQENSKKLDQPVAKVLAEWPARQKQYLSDHFEYTVRDQKHSIEASYTSLSQTKIPKVVPPQFISQTDSLNFLLKENLPGEFPFTGGIFPYRRTNEDPKRMFAGEGGPERTNRRFHFLSEHDEAKRLSTAFDSITLYGSEPAKRPDIYGKIGESGVSIAHLDDMRSLFSGFDLVSPTTSVSMTINGPAPIILAMYLNAAIDQQVDRFKEATSRLPNPEELQQIQTKTLESVRGTVQADILKEDQAQNTCIFSTEFSLKLMGDVQDFFIRNRVRNYYSVSISGYHMAEAGCNPITQLAFTLANGFTYVEYYLSRGMKIDDFAPNLSFFFSNGLDPEYSVLGRVARRIWAVAMRDVYRGNKRSQMLKYHIQTSGRSLHAQEIDFNDIRTTLQALIALYDNCNSLHTNAYDEAITTPTEESVRRALAIQMIINREFGANKCENINQGSHYIELLTDIVEEAVITEFDRLSSRGGVLGAMESQYQRTKIQEESLYYESLKDSGELPIIGVNTFLKPTSSHDSPAEIPLARASYVEKDKQLERLEKFKRDHVQAKELALKELAETVLSGRNVFETLMRTVRHASLGEISETLYRVGGQYRRSM
jgi:methylmalonyl-CoA mutase